MTAYVIGIDGGSTGTRGALSDLSGRVQCFACGEPCNHYEVGAERAQRVVRDLVAELVDDVDDDSDKVVALCMGLSGVGRTEDKKIFQPMLSDLPGGQKGLVVNDAVIALAGGTLSDIGVLAISGTGSIYFGRDREGKTMRVGGWGTLLGDEASGYYVGLEGLRAVVRSYDGREMATVLQERILAELQLETVEELVRWSLSDERTKAEIARLADLVLTATEEEDAVAYRISQRASDEIALAVHTLVRRLELDERFPVVLAGGLFRSHRSFFESVARKVRFYFPAAEVIPPRLPAFAGALLYALASAGVTVGEEVIGNLRDSCSEETEAADWKPTRSGV